MSLHFKMDDRLAASSFVVEDWDLCRVCLKNDRRWPWLCLVPRRENMRELHDLSPADRGLLIEEMALAGQALRAVYAADKINTAAYGNMVPQLHIHVFARFKTDPAWPRPVWTVQGEENPYTENEKEDELARLKACFARLRTGE